MMLKDDCYFFLGLMIALGLCLLLKSPYLVEICIEIFRIEII